MNYNHYLWSMIFVASCTPLTGVTIIHGDDAETPQAFTAKINAQAFDPSTGMFFVGLQQNATNPTYALSRATRPTFDMVQSFTPLLRPLLGSSLLRQQIDLLTVSQQPNNAPFIALVPNASEKIYVMTANGSIITNTSDLNDANGATAAGIVSLATSPTSIFAAVDPNGGTFWQANSGIAVAKIVTVNNILNSVQTKNAITGLDGNVAAPFNLSTDAITGGTNTVTAQDTGVSLYYDTLFDRLYIGIQVASGTVSGDIANAVVVAQLDSSNILHFYRIVNNSALTPGSNGIITVESGGTVVPVTAFEPKVMHTSTGPDYLIVNGGPDAVNLVGNTVYALPLVNDPASPTIHGTLADKNAALVNGVFVTPATTAGSLPQTTDAAALVGAGTLPTAADTVIADIQVYGDTVFVALNEIPSATTDAGLFSSQALFDATGKIIRWTPWQKHLVAINAFPHTTLPGGATHDGPIKFFAVDEVNGTLWIVEGTTDQTVGVTSWNHGFVSTDMISTLNSTLSTGCYSALDLPYYTLGFSGQTDFRYALFGGNGVVTFLVTGQQNGVQEIPTTDFSTAGTTLTTLIPGTVRALEYSRQVTGNGNSNYFFAGTNQGLFVFTDSAGNGFNVNTLGLLDTTPFTTRQWYQITTITGEPIAIKTSGNGNLYVLTRTLTNNPERPFTNTLYSIPFATTTGAMFAPGNIRMIAQTGVGIFANMVQFFDIALMATGASGAPAEKEQLVIATNQGLYYSNADQIANNGITDATNQTNADWTLNSPTATTAFNGIQTPNTPVVNTIWPLSVADNGGLNTFDNGTLNQFSGSGNALGTSALFNDGFIPLNFDASNTQPQFNPLNLLERFWTDGSRRFIIGHSPQNPSPVTNIISAPLNPTGLTMPSPFTLDYPVINQISHFYWITQIGGTGQLVAGTDQGVIALS